MNYLVVAICFLVALYLGYAIFGIICVTIRGIWHILTGTDEPQPYSQPEVRPLCGTPYLQGYEPQLQAYNPQPVHPVQSFSQDSQRYINYALANPEARLDLVEKEQIENGRFTLERHMKLSGPVDPQEFVQVRGVRCCMPAGFGRKALETRRDLR